MDHVPAVAVRLQQLDLAQRVDLLIGDPEHITKVTIGDATVCQIVRAVGDGEHERPHRRWADDT